MIDIYSWILSPEIGEYLRGNYRPNLMERQTLIRGAYRSAEEKLSALQELCGETETVDEQAFLGKAVKVYQFAIQEIRQCRRGESYLYQTAVQFGGDSGLFAYPFTYLGDMETGICRSYEQLGGGHNLLRQLQLGPPKLSDSTDVPSFFLGCQPCPW